MDIFNRVLVIAHVAGGLLALLIALVPMVARKGGAWHVRAGIFYFWLMMWVMASAIILSCTKRFVFFLVGVTVLSFYDTFTGVRCLYRKGGVAGNAQGTALDWTITAVTLGFGATMAAYGLMSAGNPMIATLTVLFSGLILKDSISDMWRFVRPSQDPKWWWYYHMERMMGSWIAALTALAVNQIGPRIPGNYRIWVWIGPGMLMAPVVVLWVRYYREKFAAGAARSTPSEASPRRAVKTSGAAS